VERNEVLVFEYSFLFDVHLSFYGSGMSLIDPGCNGKDDGIEDNPSIITSSLTMALFEFGGILD
jgi:hypothetical protein